MRDSSRPKENPVTAVAAAAVAAAGDGHRRRMVPLSSVGLGVYVRKRRKAPRHFHHILKCRLRDGDEIPSRAGVPFCTRLPGSTLSLASMYILAMLGSDMLHTDILLVYVRV